MLNLGLRRILLAAGLSSAALLSIALIAQIGFSLHPCHLCLLQRYPYMAVIVIALAGFFIKNANALKFMAWLCAVLFLADFAVAFYHAGVEAGWFPGPSGCTNTMSSSDSLDEMRRALADAPLVPCDQPMAKMVGLSMAGWNAVAAVLLTVATVCALKKTP